MKMMKNKVNRSRMLADSESVFDNVENGRKEANQIAERTSAKIQSELLFKNKLLLKQHVSQPDRTRMLSCRRVKENN